MKYDFLIVGAGLSGSVLAECLHRHGKSVIVLERRNHVAGNIYCENVEGITVHKYGAHIFRTNDKKVWDYVNRFSEFNRFTNSPISLSGGKLYNLPFNMNTFYQLFGVCTPEEAQKVIEKDRVKMWWAPRNLEEHALSLVGRTVYETLIKGYTEKQWGKPCSQLPVSIMKRIPLRFTFDNDYYNAAWQGIPILGYNHMVYAMLNGCQVFTGVDFNKDREYWSGIAKRVIYTGAVDELFDYVNGELEYRSLRFEDEIIEKNNVQGVAVINYADANIPYTRTIEHKHFLFGDDLPHTLITKEYPINYVRGEEPYYPIEDEKNMALYRQYRAMAIINGYELCGRLAEYKYYDMQETVRSALSTAVRILKEG